MGGHGQSDEAPPAAGDAAAFERLYVRHVDELLGFLARRTHDAQLAADLTAETFAAALTAPRPNRPEQGPAGPWLQGIALEKLGDAQRRGFVERCACRRLGMERIELTAVDAACVAALGEQRAGTLWAGRVAQERRDATVAPVLDERGPDGRSRATDDFAGRLRMQLRDAALRAERGGALEGAADAPRARTGVPAGRAAVAVLAGVVLLAVLAMAAASDIDSDTAETGAGPRVVANVALADGLGRSAQVAFGSVWLSATNDDAVLRLDPRTRRVTARIPVGTDVNLGAGAGSVWAVPRRPSVTTARVIRIDPGTNRVVARIPIPSPGARYPLGGAAILAAQRVWVVGAMGLVAVDPARDRPVRQVVLGGDFLVVDSMLHGSELWVIRADRSITRFDAVTGRRLGRLGWPASSGSLLVDGDRIVRVARRSVSLVDPAGGRTMWRTRLGTQLNDAVVVGSRLLVEGSNGATARDTLWELDSRTGRVLGTVTVPGFTITALLRVGGDAWLTTANGHVIVVAP